MTIPVFINARDRLTCLQAALAWWLEAEDVGIVTIFDNASTYPPLLDWYQTLRPPVRVVRASANLGNNAIWSSQILLTVPEWPLPYFVVSDDDVVPDPDCPRDVLCAFREALATHPSWRAVGFSLHTDDIPEHFHGRERVYTIEAPHQRDVAGEGWWRAPIDGGNAPCYRAGVELPMGRWQVNDPSAPINAVFEARWGVWSCGPAARSMRHWARHMPWYWDYDHLPEDVAYYLAHIRTDQSTAWSLMDRQAP